MSYVEKLQRKICQLELDNARLTDELAAAQNNHAADNMAQARDMDFRDSLIACCNPEDILLKGTEILVWDGCDYHIDHVEVDVESGAYYMANGTEPVSYMVLKEPES